jgi:hypothetical protein
MAPADSPFVYAGELDWPRQAKLLAQADEVLLEGLCVEHKVIIARLAAHETKVTVLPAVRGLGVSDWRL